MHSEVLHTAKKNELENKVERWTASYLVNRTPIQRLLVLAFARYMIDRTFPITITRKITIFSIVGLTNTSPNFGTYPLNN